MKKHVTFPNETVATTFARLLDAYLGRTAPWTQPRPLLNGRWSVLVAIERGRGPLDHVAWASGRPGISVEDFDPDQIDWAAIEAAGP